MTRPGPIANIEEQDLQALNFLPQNEGIGFNELWRRLKGGGHSVSYSTLSKTLKRLRSQGYVDFIVETQRRKIPQHVYTKTGKGQEYELHLSDKLRLSLDDTKKIVKARRGKIKYNQVILGEIPYTCEIELSAPSLTQEKEDAITAFAGTVGDTATSNIAEILNQAYSGFISLLGDGKKDEAFDYLKKALAFKLKLTIAFDGSRAALDDHLQQTLEYDKEMATAIQAINTPSYTELLSCWIYSLLNVITPAGKFPYNLTKISGWAQLITERSNRMRAEKRLPLLDPEEVELYLNEQVDKGMISITPVHVDTGLIQFNDRLPSPEPEESYSFLLGLTSTLKAMFENTT